MRGKPTLALADLDARLRTFFLEVYHRREHAETKTPPVERWEANGFLPRMPDSLEQLDLLLIHGTRTRQVQVDGIYFQSSAICRQRWHKAQDCAWLIIVASDV